jgi:hypothetical protein
VSRAATLRVNGVEVRNNPFAVPHRNREGTYRDRRDRESPHNAADQRGGAKGQLSDKMQRQSVVWRKLVLADREAV